MNQDETNLNLLAIFHYIVGGLMALFACFPIIYIGLGVAMMAGAFDGQNTPPPPIFGLIFVIVGSVFVLLGWVLATVVILAGRKLHQRRAWTYCIVVAAIECIFMPFGTILGVFTIIVLMKESVKPMFSRT